MRILRSIAEINELDRNKSIGLVPTMGFFHEGHLQLMRAARKSNDTVVVSLFVNPTQFGPKEDFGSYPRDEARDANMAGSVGVDFLFVPSVAEIYPRTTTAIVPSGAALRWEGERRPGHFEGVATVVCKLFNIVKPDVAYFGLKDFQQCAVIRQMVEDLNIPVVLQFEDTVREPDGLAMSSRNVYLSGIERSTASHLYAELNKVALESAGKGRNEVERAISNSTAALTELGFQVDYLEVVDRLTLEPSSPKASSCHVIAAVWLGKTRLIDNLQIHD